MKLKEVIKNRFYQKHLQNSTRVAQDFEFLDKHVADVFPNQNTINHLFKGLNFADKEFKFNYNVRILPFYTRDTEWMSSYMERAISQLVSLKDNEKANKEVLPFNSLDSRTFFYSPYFQSIPASRRNIAKYITFSPKYAQCRDEFEQNLTVGYINGLSYENGYDFYLTAGQKETCLNSNDCDKNFRSSVIDAMTSLGLGKENIEAGLEMNAHLWRKPMMCRAFYNEKSLFLPEQLQLLQDTNPALHKDLMDKENQYLRVWIRLRENEYYQRHGKVMEKLGIRTVDMKLNPQQLAELNKQNQQLSADYDLANIRALNFVEDLQRMQKNKNQNTVFGKLL